MFQTTLKRIIKSGLIGFYRNRFISLATIFIMTITLLLISSVFFARFVVTDTLAQMKGKVDINVYFTLSAPDEKILVIVNDVKKLPEVASVEYVTKEEALETFKENHKNDELTLGALEELGKNPFGGVLSIKARDTSQYDSIARFLEGGSSYIDQNPGLVDKINYRNNKAIIDKLNIITTGIEVWGNIISGIFVLISVMITYVTIRLAIYNFRDEISVMKLVGADNMYVRGPFIVEAILYGITATFMTIITLLPLTIWGTKKLVLYLGGISFYEYYTSHFFFLLFSLLFIATSVGAVSSFLAVRKYLG